MTVVATMNEETVIQVKNFRTRELATLISYEGKKKTIFYNKNSKARNFTVFHEKFSTQGMKKARVLIRRL